MAPSSDQSVFLTGTCSIIAIFNMNPDQSVCLIGTSMFDGRIRIIGPSSIALKFTIHVKLPEGIILVTAFFWAGVEFDRFCPPSIGVGPLVFQDPIVQFLRSKRQRLKEPMQLLQATARLLLAACPGQRWSIGLSPRHLST